MKSPAISSLAALLLFFLALPVTASPGAHGPNGEHLDEAGSVGGGAGMARLPDGSLHIPKGAQRRMAVRTELVAEGEYPVSVELNGLVAIDPNAGGRLQAGHPGWIEPPRGGFPPLGQAVRKGEVLAVLRHKYEPYEMGNQQAQMARLSATRTVAEQRQKRLEALEGSVPQKEIEAARAEVRSLSSQSAVIGNSLHELEPLRSPASGVIAHANAIAGQVVAPGDILFEVVDPSRLMIEASSPDARLAGLVEGGALKQEGAALRFIGAGRSLKNGSIPLLFRSVEGNTPLVVGQPVTVIAQLREKLKGIRLPAAAIVRSSSNETLVWIKSGAQRFIPQPVEVRQLDGRHVVVVKGLAPENRVVVSAAPLINQIR